MNIEEIKRNLKDLISEKNENLVIASRLASPEHNKIDYKGWVKIAEIDRKEYELLNSVLEFLESKHSSIA